MIDFTNWREVANTYGGSEKKKKLEHEGNYFLVKFPDPVREKKNQLSYMNNQFSEYVGCKIFESVGIPVQETLLGTYQEPSGKEKIVVACKDFTYPNNRLHEFSDIANSITSIDRRISTRIEDVYDVVNASPFIANKSAVMNSFWDMFVVDTLLGNRDRHLDNWGFIEDNGTFVFAPVYDCGSALHPLLTDERCAELLSNASEFKNETFNVYSCYNLDGKRINCAQIFQAPPVALQEAILRIMPRVNLEKIRDIIDATPGMSPIRKEFMYQSIVLRKELILDKAFKKVASELCVDGILDKATERSVCFNTGSTSKETSSKDFGPEK